MDEPVSKEELFETSDEDGLTAQAGDGRPSGRSRGQAIEIAAGEPSSKACGASLRWRCQKRPDPA